MLSELKLRAIKLKKNLILSRPASTWTRDDREFIEIASEQRMELLLEKIKL